MKTLIAFIKKEFLEQLRMGQLLILGILFVLFGIMNPAIAKLTPVLFELMADSLESSGVIVTAVTVTAMDSWVQFFKNIPLALIIFLLMESSIFTKEYQSGTLVLALTKGLHRYKVVLAKTTITMSLWTLGYWCCFAITYGYNSYFWDNSIAKNLFFAVLCWWLFGLWTIALATLFSSFASSNTTVLAGIGGTVLVSYLLGMLPKCKQFVPTHLMDGNSLLYGIEKTADYRAACILTVVLCIGAIVAAVPIMNKKML